VNLMKIGSCSCPSRKPGDGRTSHKKKGQCHPGGGAMSLNGIVQALTFEGGLNEDVFQILCGTDVSAPSMDQRLCLGMDNLVLMG
jgi:hypothetical protein